MRGDYYFLGVNPAGSEEDHPKTVRDSLGELVAFTEVADRNQYLEVSWYSDPEDKRRRPLQKRFEFLFNELGVEDPARSVHPI